MRPINVRDLEGTELTDRLRLDKALRIGLNGYIFEGSLLSLKRSVGRCAVKLCRLKERYHAENFVQELREQPPLNHPRLVYPKQFGIVDSGPAQGWVYLTMELAEYSLQDLLDQETRLPFRQVNEMLLDITEGLAYLHHKGISHAAVRPSHILSTAEGWKLSGIEFRSALARRVEEIGEEENHFVFQSPEILQSQIEEPSGDLWSLGVVAHAALTSRLPFSETSDQSRSELQWRIINVDPEPEALGQPLDDFLGRVLQRTPSARSSALSAHRLLGGKTLMFDDGPAAEQPEPKVPVVEVSVPQAPLVTKTRSESSIPNWVPLAAVAGLAGAFLLVLVGGVWGYFKHHPRRGATKSNVGSADLRTKTFEIGQLDARGRLTRLAGKAPCLTVELGEGSNLYLLQIPTGEFDMGSPGNEAYREANEGPQHRVRVDAFYMTQTEISQGQWRRVCSFPAVNRPLSPTPSKVQGQNLPVTDVSYEECLEFCARLSKKTGRVFRLATEAEWEYACRGGPSLQPFHFGPTITPEVATFRASKPYLNNFPPGKDPKGPAPVSGHSAANPFGLLDMHGNVKEWCLDKYLNYSEERQVNPLGKSDSTTERVVRGGGYQTYSWSCRSAYRGRSNETESSPDIGFRVVAPEQIEVTLP